jgi:hypothetical protein
MKNWLFHNIPSVVPICGEILVLSAERLDLSGGPIGVRFYERIAKQTGLRNIRNMLLATGWAMTSKFPLSSIYRFRNNSIKKPLLPIRQKMAESAIRSAGDKNACYLPAFGIS